jgi:hypothetical protein
MKLGGFSKASTTKLKATTSRKPRIKNAEEEADVRRGPAYELTPEDLYPQWLRKKQLLLDGLGGLAVGDIIEVIKYNDPWEHIEPASLVEVISIDDDLNFGGKTADGKKYRFYPGDDEFKIYIKKE